MTKTTKIIFLELILIVLILTGCGNKNTEKQIIGTWIDKDGEFSYEYKSDGKAIMNGKEASYTINGDILTITYPDTNKKYEYKISLNGTTLTLVNKAGNEYNYIKKQ